MTKQFINVASGYWKVFIYYVPDEDGLIEISEMLSQLDCPYKDIEQIIDNLKCCRNTGSTYTNTEEKCSIVCINKTTNEGQFINTVVHELTHVAVHICNYYNTPLDGEQFAYLIGYLVYNVHKIILDIIEREEYIN